MFLPSYSFTIRQNWHPWENIMYIKNNNNNTFLSIDSKIYISSLDPFPTDSQIQLCLLSISNETDTNLSIIFFLLNLFYVCLPILLEDSDIFPRAQVKTLATVLSVLFCILNCQCISKLFSHCRLKNWTDQGMSLHCILSEMPQWPFDSFQFYSYCL